MPENYSNVILRSFGTNEPKYSIGIDADGVIVYNGTTLGGGLFAQTADGTAVANTTVRTTLIGSGQGVLTVPANGFRVGDSFSLVMGGTISTVGGGQEIRIGVVSYNGVTTVDLANSGAQTLSNLSAGESFELKVNFTIRSIGAAGVASIISMSSFITQKSSNGSIEGFEFTNIENTDFDTTLGNALDVYAQWGAADPANSIQSLYFTLTKIY